MKTTHRKRSVRVLVSLILLLLLPMNAGCVEGLVVPGLGLFGAGWVVGRLTAPTTTETQCYRNGEPIDCAELPPEYSVE